jgi:hypothetical protein
MHGNAGFNPADQLIPPNAIQLAKGWQPWERDGLVGIRTFTKNVERIALKALFVAVSPAAG